MADQRLGFEKWTNLGHEMSLPSRYADYLRLPARDRMVFCEEAKMIAFFTSERIREALHTLTKDVTLTPRERRYGTHHGLTRFEQKMLKLLPNAGDQFDFLTANAPFNPTLTLEILTRHYNQAAAAGIESHGTSEEELAAIQRILDASMRSNQSLEILRIPGLRSTASIGALIAEQDSVDDVVKYYRDYAEVA